MQTLYKKTRKYNMLLSQTFSITYYKDENDIVYIKDRFLLWTEYALLNKTDNIAIIAKKGLFRKKEQIGTIQDLIFRIDLDFITQPARSAFSLYCGTLILKDLRFQLVREYGVENIKQYFQDFITFLDFEIKLEETVI